MKKILLLLFFFAFFAFPWCPVSAHILETDGTIGAVMHIDPADDPVVNEKSTFYFEFKDKTGQFTPQDCDCTVAILQNNKQIYTQSLSYDTNNHNLSNASFSFIFPQKDIYIIQISGKPKIANSFQKFNLTFSQRVSRVSNNTKERTDYFFSSHFIYFLPAILGIIFLLYQVSKKQKNILKKTLILLLVSNLLYGIHFYHFLSDHHAMMKQNKYACCTVAVLHLQNFVTMKPVVILKGFIKQESYIPFSLISNTLIRIRSPTYI